MIEEVETVAFEALADKEGIHLGEGAFPAAFLEEAGNPDRTSAGLGACLETEMVGVSNTLGRMEEVVTVGAFA